MTEENKDLLLKDLSARVPYGVKAYVKNLSKLDRKYYEGVYTVESVHPSLNDIFIYASTENDSIEVILGDSDYVIKPFLFPLSSMTEEQQLFYSTDLNYMPYYQRVDWFNKHHIDYRGLIPMGIAIDATGLDVYKS